MVSALFSRRIRVKRLATIHQPVVEIPTFSQEQKSQKTLIAKRTGQSKCYTRCFVLCPATLKTVRCIAFTDPLAGFKSLGFEWKRTGNQFLSIQTEIRQRIWNGARHIERLSSFISVVSQFGFRPRRFGKPNPPPGGGCRSFDVIGWYPDKHRECGPRPT